MKKIFSFCPLLVFSCLLLIHGASVTAAAVPGAVGLDPSRWISAVDSSWREVFGDGLNGTVLAIAVSGTDLYVGGEFTTADGLVVNRIAKWDGSSWSSLGGGVNGPVHAIAIHQGDLYAGGVFSQAGGVSVSNIARWNGSTWSNPGGGPDGPVYALVGYGSYLIAGGDFSAAGGSAVNNIARWSGSGWFAMNDGADCAVYALATDGYLLFAGGAFTLIDGKPAAYIAQWNGYDWYQLSDGMDAPVMALAVRGVINSGGYLFAGGYFTHAGGVRTNHVARWNGNYWWVLGSGTDRVVRSLAATDSILYAGGWLTTAGGVPKNFVARYKESAWSDLSGGLNAPVCALAASGTRVYAGGEFDSAGTIRTSHIGLWDPDSSLLFGPPIKVRIKLTVTNDQSIRNLYFGVRAGAALGIWGVDPDATAVDSLEGESELPPVVGGIFDARFISPAGETDLFGGGSWADFRNFKQTVQVDTYRVEFHPGPSGYPFRLGWSGTAVGKAYLGDVTLLAGTTSYDMKAQDTALVTDELIDQVLIVAGGPNLPVLFPAGWNLISIPNDVPDASKPTLFPDVPGNAYDFDQIQGYQTAPVLEPGKGYWLKFPSLVHGLSFDGPERVSDSIEVAAGWNLIGTLNVPTPVAAIISDPPGMTTGNFFGYSNTSGFSAVSVLESMRGYWVKTSQGGTLYMSGTAAVHPGQAIRIVPDGEQPPGPPDAPAHDSPPTVTEYRLEEAFPNPFNPVTRIEYALPGESRVTLTVYNVFGQKVAVLLDEDRPAGTHSVQWDASSLASGVYFCRMEAVSLSGPPTLFTQTKKTVLMK